MYTQKKKKNDILYTLDKSPKSKYNVRDIIEKENYSLSDFIKTDSKSISNKASSDDFDQKFLSGFWGDDYKPKNQKNKPLIATDKNNDSKNIFGGSQLKNDLKSIANSSAQKNNLNFKTETLTNFKANPDQDEKRNYEDILKYSPNNNTDKLYYASEENSDSFFGKAINKIFTKEVNNHIYTSNDSCYTEKGTGIRGVDETNCYYAEKDGKRYRANSFETVYYRDWNEIDENFLDETFEKLIDEANKKPTDSKRVFMESINGELDFKKFLPENKLYLINGVLYNNNEAGNFMWAYFLESHGWLGCASGLLAQGGSLMGPFISDFFKNNNGDSHEQQSEKSFTDKLKEIRFDEPHDVRARWAGIKYYYEKNNMLWLYYIVYGAEKKI